MGSAWAPPVWMTLFDDRGRRILNPQHLGTYARYLVKAIEAYAALEPPILFDAITVQNEPFYYNSSYPTLWMPEETQREFIGKHLGPAIAVLKQRGHPVKLISHDHNWNMWKRAALVLDDPEVRRYVDGVAFHAYGGTPADQSNITARYPNMPIYFTESTGVEGGKTTPAEDLQWDMSRLLLGSTRHGAKTVLKWNLVLDENSGPHRGGCSTCRGMFTTRRVTDSQGRQSIAVDTRPEFYAFALASKYVQPGAVRIQVESGDLDSGAFKNPDGSLVLLARNGLDRSHPIRIVNGEQTFAHVIEPDSATAIHWWPAQPAATTPNQPT
jgi:glucosylceramidase